MMRRLMIIACLVCGFAMAQEKEQAALYKEILNCSDSTLKLKLYEKLSHNYYHDSHFERALHFNKKGLELARNMRDTSAMIIFHKLLVESYSVLGAPALKFQSGFEGLKLSEEKKDRVNMCVFYRILGEAYWSEGDNKKSIDYYSKALSIALSRKDTLEIAGIYNNLGLSFRSLGDYDEANNYYFKSIELGQLKKDDNILTKTFNNLGFIRYIKGDLLGAMEYYNLSLKYAEAGKDKFQTGLVLGNIGSMHMALKKYKEAEECLNRSLEIALEIKDLEGEKECYFNLTNLFDSIKDHKKALNYYRKFFVVTTQIAAENKEKDLKREEAKHDFENEIKNIQKDQALKDALAESEKEKSRHILLSIAIGFFIVLVLLVIIYNRFKLSQAQKVVIENQKKLVDEKQKEILDSIHYAKRIQTALLAHKDFVDANLPQNFIYFRPKDIVSGDFYWATKHRDVFYLAVCDSTGHGVPGAFMSLLNIGFLSEAINEKDIQEPASVFDHVRERLIKGISKEGQKDGFDGILACFNEKLDKVIYVGAHNAPILIRNKILVELTSNKMPVGIGEKSESFVQGEFNVQKGDILYLYTDGYADQFGGPKGKKFKYSELNKLLLSVSDLPMTEQKERIEKEFTSWKGDLEQVDDVLIVGIKF
jgi:serine phosphatase RsbU (regulator of sigma subunit)